MASPDRHRRQILGGPVEPRLVEPVESSVASTIVVRSHQMQAGDSAQFEASAGTAQRKRFKLVKNGDGSFTLETA